MPKSIRFTVSIPASEFKDIESRRRKAGRTRSQFIRDAVAGWRQQAVRTPSLKEDQTDYGAPPAADLAEITDMAERRWRAIAAAGKFRSGVSDLSSNHDRYLEEAFAERRPEKKKG